MIKIWEWSAETNTYNNVHTMPDHTDWVRDVAWSPTVLSKSYIASASQDKTVRIYTSNNPSLSEPIQYNSVLLDRVLISNLDDWKHTALKFEAVAWRVSWSLSGNVLAVSTGDNRISLWKERLNGQWECVKTIEE